MRSYVRALLLGLGVSVSVAACGWDPRKPFERNSPAVDKAIEEIDAGRPKEARERLGAYVLATQCDAGRMAALGAGDASNATFDLGLALFQLAEQFGRRFEDPLDPPGKQPHPDQKRIDLLRGDQIDCARAVLDAILSRDLPAELEARARYLRGNLAFLDHDWQDAIDDYDKALRVIPGVEGDAGDAIGRDAAWNRALALRNKDEEKRRDAGADADADADGPDGDDADADGAPDAPQDGPQDGPGDRDGDAAKDAPDDGPREGGADAGDGGQDGKDAGGDAAAPDAGKNDPDKREAGAPDAGEPQPTTSNQDDRVLDQFEQAPTWQREEAKSRAGARRVKGMQDK